VFICHFLRKPSCKDEIEITTLFNILQVLSSRKRQEYKGLFIHSVKCQFISMWFPEVKDEMRHGSQWAREREHFP
jgi:hypothetical protein